MLTTCGAAPASDTRRWSAAFSFSCEGGAHFVWHLVCVTLKREKGQDHFWVTLRSKSLAAKARQPAKLSHTADSPK